LNFTAGKQSRQIAGIERRAAPARGGYAQEILSRRHFKSMAICLSVSVAILEIARVRNGICNYNAKSGREVRHEFRKNPGKRLIRRRGGIRRARDR
jgi:hypothetical protein